MSSPTTLEHQSIHDPFAAPGRLTPPGAEPVIRLEAIEKYFGSNHVLRGCTLEVYPGETICLIGRSGSGKSTLLRCTNFLEEPTVGAVEVDGIRIEADPLHARDRRHREQIRQIRLPSTSTAPTVGSSRKFVQRRSVLLPDPDRPMRQIVSPG